MDPAVLWRIDPHSPEPEIIRLAASAILAEGVIIYPTETLYGLGAHPLSQEAVKKVYRVKGRDFDKPLPLIATNRAAALSAVTRWPELAQILAEAFWPGPLTLVLAASPRLPGLIHAGTGKIGVRVSSHPVARALAEASGGLVTATSANESGRPASSDPAAIAPAFAALTEGILDAGPLPGDVPSTVVDLSTAAPRLLRAGAIPWEAIEERIRRAS